MSTKPIPSPELLRKLLRYDHETGKLFWRERPVEIRGGGFAGMFEYAEFAPKAEARGWPTMGDFVLVIGPHVKARFSNGVDLNVGFIPLYTNKTSGVFTFSVSIPIGGN